MAGEGRKAETGPSAAAARMRLGLGRLFHLQPRRAGRFSLALSGLSRTRLRPRQLRRARFWARSNLSALPGAFDTQVGDRARHVAGDDHDDGDFILDVLRPRRWPAPRARDQAVLYAEQRSTDSSPPAGAVDHRYSKFLQGRRLRRQMDSAHVPVLAVGDPCLSDEVARARPAAPDRAVAWKRSLQG